VLATNFQLQKAKNAIGRADSFVNRRAGRSTNVVDEAYSEASDGEGYKAQGVARQPKN